MRLESRFVLVCGILLATFAGPVCRASPIAAYDVQISQLIANGRRDVRFRVDDHGALRALRTVYVSRNALLWVIDDQPTPAALALLRTLRQAEVYGLEPRDYDADGLAALAATLPGIDRAVATGDGGNSGAVVQNAAGDTQRRVTFDINLSAAALKLVCDLHYGRIDPRQAGFDLGTRRTDDLDLARELVALAASRDIGSQLAAVEPQFLHYRLLERTLPRYRLLAASEAGRDAKVRKIELTLERWRWLPAFRTPPIIVNIPQFRLFAFRTTADRAADILQMDVIVGRTFPRTRTPVFVADMTSVIFRPYWDVPRSITVREELPKVRANPAYLRAQHLEIVRGASDDTATPLPPTAASIQLLATGVARLRQRPGPDNALGLIKFDLPNRHDVYLHSTPARQLFLQPRRAFSHGCIRVSDPIALAAYVFRDTPGDWTPANIEAAMNGTRTRRVRLAQAIRVIILYGTVLAKEDGEVLFFHDLYGQDRKLERLLGLPPVRMHRIYTRDSKLANRD